MRSVKNRIDEVDIACFTALTEMADPMLNVWVVLPYSVWRGPYWSVEVVVR